jgi:hypothetical protein
LRLGLGREFLFLFSTLLSRGVEVVAQIMVVVLVLVVIELRLVFLLLPALLLQ